MFALFASLSAMPWILYRVAECWLMPENNLILKRNFFPRNRGKSYSETCLKQLLDHSYCLCFTKVMLVRLGTESSVCYKDFSLLEDSALDRFYCVLRNTRHLSILLRQAYIWTLSSLTYVLHNFDKILRTRKKTKICAQIYKSMVIETELAKGSY